MARTTDNPSDASAAELISRLSADGSQLVRDEIALARIEVGEKAKKVGLGAGFFGAAGVLAAYGFGVLLAAAVLALALVMPAWAAALIVAAVLLVGAGVAALQGRSNVKDGTPAVPEAAIENVKADIATVQEARHHDH